MLLKKQLIRYLKLILFKKIFKFKYHIISYYNNDLKYQKKFGEILLFYKKNI